MTTIVIRRSDYNIIGEPGFFCEADIALMGDPCGLGKTQEECIQDYLKSFELMNKFPLTDYQVVVKPSVFDKPTRL